LIVPVPFAVPQASTWGTLRLDISERDAEMTEDDGLRVILVDDDGPRVMVIVELEITMTVVIVDGVWEPLLERLGEPRLGERLMVEN
jgi:hypothetical protein